MPKLDAWQKRPAPTLEEVETWANEGNLGLRTGRVSGVVVIDEDTAKGGCVELSGGEIPVTPTVETGGGGRHFYFACPPAGFKNSASRIGPHIDTRGDGGQVVFVGSLHPETGKEYRWVDGLSPDVTPLATLPEWAIAALATKPKTRTPESLEHLARGGVPKYAQSALEAELNAVASASEGTRNDQLNRSAFNLGQLVAGGALPDVVTRADLEHAALTAGLEVREIRLTIDSAFRAATASPRSAPVPRRGSDRRGTPREDAPVVEIVADRREVMITGGHVDASGEYHEVGNDRFVKELISVLPEHLYYRRMGVAGRLTGERGDAKFRELTVASTRVLIDEHIRLIRWVKKKGDDIASRVYQPCTPDLAMLFIDYAGQAAPRELRHLSHYPVFLGPDFTPATPGWNPVDGVYYDEPADLEGLEWDFETEAITAILDDLVVDFPFKTHASRQNFFGLLLTPLLRICLGGNVPMHLIQSPIERTGKTKLAGDVFGTIISGQQLSAIQMSGTDEERDKRILSVLRRGETLVHIDNVREFLDSASIASLLTATEYSGRVLGKSELATVPNNITMVATGNNVRATGEIAKRTVPIVLQPTTDAPEERNDFRHPDLMGYLYGVRRQVLSALGSMIQRWSMSQRRLHAPPKGGFERWSGVVGGILKLHSYDEWRANEREWIRLADPNGEDLRSLVEEWMTKFSIAKVQASELQRMAEEMQIFPHAMKATTERGRQIAFARTVLGKHVDSPVAGCYIRCTGSGANRFYYLEPQNDGLEATG